MNKNEVLIQLPVDPQYWGSTSNEVKHLRMKAQEPTKGMSLEEARLYIEKRQEETFFGYSWEQIAAMQRSGKLKLNPTKARAKGRPCIRCGKPSGSVGLLPQCKRCLKSH